MAPSTERSGRLSDRVHMSLLAGLLSHIGIKDERGSGEKRRRPAEFAGARGARFAIFPDSVLARKPPQWVVAAELVETTRLWARTAARIEPEWAEPLAADLVRRSYSEPHWDAKRGAAMALEKVTLYGLPIVADRKVNYARVDPAAAREMFITGALVEGDWEPTTSSSRVTSGCWKRRQPGGPGQAARHRRRRRGAFRLLRDQRIPKDVTSAQQYVKTP